MYMFAALSEEMQFILSNALTAGTLSIAIATFALSQRARRRIAPVLLFTGSLSSIFLLLSSICSSISFFQTIVWLSDLSIILFCCGVFILPIPVIYLVYKLLKIRILIGVQND